MWLYDPMCVAHWGCFWNWEDIVLWLVRTTSLFPRSLPKPSSHEMLMLVESSAQLSNNHRQLGKQHTTPFQHPST